MSFKIFFVFFSFFFLNQVFSQKFDDIPLPAPVNFSRNCDEEYNRATPIPAKLPPNINFDPIVEIGAGKIQGKLLTTKLGDAGYIFLGIPYGEPTSGKNRFADPIPRKPWNGILNATEYSKVCMQQSQISPWNDPAVMSEDCLTLNVFAPIDALEKGKKYPVLYYIHGSAWDFDSPRSYNPTLMIENFVSTGLILITVQYRLGALGFWTTGNEFGANWAVKDIILGLKWTQEEIKNFGGDPDQVTIMGLSSGGIAVSLLAMSPKTKGLFKQAVMNSGSATSTATFKGDDLGRYRDFSISVGCTDRSEWSSGQYDQIVECMRNLDPLKLVNGYLQFENSLTLQAGGLPILSTSPRMDGPNGIFPAPAEEMLKDRQNVATLVGATLQEYSMMKFMWPLATAATAEMICDTVAEMDNPDQPDLVANACKMHYVEPNREAHDSSDHEFWRNQAVQVFNDFLFVVPAYSEAAAARSKGAKAFLYSFDYVKTGLDGIAPWHAMDQGYVFGTFCIYPFDDRDRTLASFFPKYFTNFAKFGNPTPEPIRDVVWDPLKTPTGYNYLSIDVQPQMKENFNLDSVQFWAETVPQLKKAFISTKKILRLNFDQKIQKEKLNENRSTNVLGIALGVVGATILLATIISVLVIRKKKMNRAKKLEMNESQPLRDFDSEIYYKSF